jgi:polyisoprenoid-binding protein YceI
MRQRLTAAFALLLMSAAVAPAGPLEWSWSMSVSSLTGGSTLFAPNSADPTRGYVLPFPAVESGDAGPIQPQRVPATASIGVTTFLYQSIDGHPSSWVSTLAPEDPNASKFKVTIKATDLASGDTGVEDFVGTLSYRMENGAVIPDVAFDRAFVSWQLGEHQFDINLTTPFNSQIGWRSVGSEWTISRRDGTGGSNGGGGGVPGGEEPGGEVPGGQVPGGEDPDDDIPVPGGNGGVGSPVETPEPGTLMLGGIALAGGLGAWWRKRRK